MPVLNSCHRHVYYALVSWSNHWQLVQVLSAELFPISSHVQLGTGLSHSFIKFILLCLQQILDTFHIGDYRSETDTHHNLSIGRFLLITFLHITSHKKKIILSRYCNIIGAALEKTRKRKREKKAVCLYCWNYFWRLPVSILYMELLSLSLEASVHGSVLSHLSFSLSLSRLKCVKQAPLSLASSQKPAFIPSKMASHQLCFQSNALSTNQSQCQKRVNLHVNKGRTFQPPLKLVQ